MKRSFTLSEKEIKEAIVAYVANTADGYVDTKNVILNVEKARGQFDTEGYGYVVTATALEGER